MVLNLPTTEVHNPHSVQVFHLWKRQTLTSRAEPPQDLSGRTPSTFGWKCWSEAFKRAQTALARGMSARLDAGRGGSDNLHG